MNIEDIKNVILETYGEVREEKETADSPDTHKITDLPKSFRNQSLQDTEQGNILRKIFYQVI